MPYLYERLAQEKNDIERIKKIHENSPLPKIDNRQHITVQTDMSHTYGNALAYIQNWLIEKFPKDLFKTIHVNSKIAHRQIKSTPHEYIKKIKPMIIFRPRIPDYNEDRFLKGTLFTEKLNDVYSQWGSSTLLDFFNDNETKLTIKYQPYRAVMYCDVVLSFATLMQQLNYYQYIINALVIDHPFRLVTNFESYLAPEMLEILSKYSKIPIIDECGNTKEFVQYMNQHSGFPITYRLQGSSQTREFYRYYPVSIDTIITDLTKDEGDRVNQVMDQYQISFTIRMEFTTNGFYFLYGNKLEDLHLKTIDTGKSEIIPIYTDVFMKEDLNLQPEWIIYNQASCRLDEKKDIDIIDITQLFNKSILDTLDYHKKNGLPIFDFIDIKIRRQGQMIHENYDYKIDWDKLEITFLHPSSYFTYQIVVCINVEYINNLMKNIYHLK